ncbi:MAG: hypothetical protein ABJQ34_21440 [Paracoccaceae bacterium]
MTFGALFPDTSMSSRVTWSWLWPVLGLALLARLVLAFWGDVLVHPDETYQYHEQAFRVVHGYGFVPWEYSAGIRSWLIPGLLACLLWAGNLVGIDTPAEIGSLVEITLCLISLVLPVGLYRLTQGVASERAAIVAFLFGCFWHHFLYYAHKPMPGILATYVLIWMMVLMLRAPTSARLWMVGLLSGLVLTLRYQLVPALGLLNLFALMRLRQGYLPMFLGNLVALLAAGLLDLVTWGGFLSSFIDNFRVNFMYDIASNFGVAPIEFYAKRFGVETGGLVLLAAMGVVMLWPRLWPMIVAVIVCVAFLHIPAHKEFRFVSFAMPFVVMAAAVIACHPRLPAVLAPAFVLFWGAGVSLVFVANYVGVGAPLGHYQEAARHGITLMRAARDTGPVTGIDIRTRALAIEHLGGYSTLGHPAVFHIGADRPKAEAVISHIVIGPEDPEPTGFTRLAQSGPFTLWYDAVSDPAPKLDPDSLFLPIPDNIGQNFEPFGTQSPLVLR